MTAKHPTFLVRNGEGSSYLFRTIIPRDIRQYLNNSKEIRVSLLTGLKSEAKHLAQLLKYQVDKLFDDLRSGNNSITCVFFIKAKLKEYLYQVRVNGINGERAINPNLSLLPYLFSQPRIDIPMEQKLVADYVNRLKFKDIIDFCENNDIEYTEDEFPQKHIRRARQNLVKKIGEEIGFTDFADDIARDILTGYLSSLDYEGFKTFFTTYSIDDYEIRDMLENPAGNTIDSVIELLETEEDIIPIAKRIGVRWLSEMPEEEKVDKPEPLAKLWNRLKSKNIQPSDNHSTKTKTPKEPSGNTKKISIVIDAYIEEMKAAGIWNIKSEKEKRASLNGLVEIVGDIFIDELSYETGREYKTKLMKLPANRNKIPKYRDLTVDQILMLGDVTPMSIRTVNNNLSTVIAFMNWTRKQGYIKDNYFEGLKLPSTKMAQDERKPFSDKDLKKIFDPKTYGEATRGVDYRYWVPLLGLFTGARINEICQLHVADIKKVDDLWCVEFRSNSGDEKNPKKLKNKASERLIPLHETLIELGFIDFVNTQRKANEIRLFPDLTFTSGEGFARKAGRWFNEQYLRKTLGIKDPDKSFHSFRHTVADRLKQLGVAESFISELLGHSSADSMSFGRYRKRYQPKVLMKEAVTKLQYRLEFKDQIS